MKRVSVVEQVIEALDKAEKASIAINEPSDFGKAVNAELRENGYSIYEENAILRKTLVKVLTHLNLIDTADFSEFKTYNDKVNEVKTEIKSKEENR